MVMGSSRKVDFGMTRAIFIRSPRLDWASSSQVNTNTRFQPLYHLGLETYYESLRENRLRQIQQHQTSSSTEGRSKRSNDCVLHKSSERGKERRRPGISLILCAIPLESEEAWDCVLKSGGSTG